MSQHDDLFHELGRTLDVAPSRDFSKGVHTRIARRRTTMRTTMAALAIAASVLLGVIARWPAPEAQNVDTIALGTVVGTQDPALHPAPLVPIAPVRPPSVRVATASAVTAERDAVGAGRLLVVTNQMAVLQAAWAGARGAVVETEASPAEPVAPSELMPIVVEPVRVLPVVIVDQQTPFERLPVIRRAVAAIKSK